MELVANVIFERRQDKIYRYQISENQYKRYKRVLEARNRVYASVKTEFSQFPVIVLVRSVRQARLDDNYHKLKKLYGIVT